MNAADVASAQALLRRFIAELGFGGQSRLRDLLNQKGYTNVSQSHVHHWCNRLRIPPYVAHALIQISVEHDIGTDYMTLEALRPDMVPYQDNDESQVG